MFSPRCIHTFCFLKPRSVRVSPRTTATDRQNLTLEELDTVFSVGNKEHAKYYWDKLPWYLRKYVMRRDVEPYPALYQLADDDDVKREK